MKTSTGYAEKGASVSDVKAMRNNLPQHVKIKASGGIRHYAFARELMEAGADRLGCSSGLQDPGRRKNGYKNDYDEIFMCPCHLFITGFFMRRIQQL